MTKDAVKLFLEKVKNQKKTLFNIVLKDRNPIKGFIISNEESQYLNKKNFWHILTKLHEKEWKETLNPDLLLIFPGEAFIKISIATKPN